MSVLDNAQQAIESTNLAYVDALYDWQTDLAIRKNKDRETVSTRSLKGISLRTFTDRGWRYMNSNETSPASIRKLARKLRSGSSGHLLKEKLLLPPPIEKDETASVEKNPLDVSLEEKLERIREIFNLARGLESRIVDVRVNYSETVLERGLVTVPGTKAVQRIPRTRISLTVIVRDGDVTDYDFLLLGGVAGYEVVESVSEQVIRTTVSGALEQLKATQPPPGHHRVILDPGVVGTVCHESFGHGLEADQALRGRSYLKDMLGKRVASEIVTMYEDPSLRGAHGSYFFDDDGTPSRKNTLVEDGILVSFLHDMETAAAMGASLTGSSRTQNASRRRFIRMSNTYAKPGDWTVDDMISDMKDGVMMMRWQSGMEDPLGGGMQVVAKKGYLVENGKKTTPLKSITLTGRVLEVLGSVDAISREGFTIDSGNCGKGAEDFVPVGSGGTWWRTKAVIG